MVLIAYSERCWILDLRRRFSFRTKDQSWSLESFVSQSFIKVWERTEKASDIDIRRGTESASLASLARELYTFSIGYYNKSKECLKAVKVLPDPLPQYAF